MAVKDVKKIKHLLIIAQTPLFVVRRGLKTKFGDGGINGEHKRSTFLVGFTTSMVIKTIK